MKSQKLIYTFFAVIGTLLLFLCIYKTRELYFKPTNNNQSLSFADEDLHVQSYAVPKLKMLRNEKLIAEKIKSEPDLLSKNVKDGNTDLTLDKSNQQILTHKYLIKVLSQQQNYLRRCYENHLRSNSTHTGKGMVVVDFMVLPFGEIRDVEIKDSSFKDKTFENCIKTVFLRTQVKKFNGEKFLITFPLEFE